MTMKELKKLEKSLPRGSKWKLSVRLGVDPSKITKAFDGLVKDEEFMARLEASAIALVQEGKAAKVKTAQM